MGITVLSPHSGEAVKVRDQDVGRAVKDREGRIFYVLEKSDGTGYYGAMTRAGGEREEQRALKTEARSAEVEEHKQTVTGGGGVPVHDATGKKRSGGLGKLILLLILLAILAVAGWYGYQMFTGNEPQLELPEMPEMPELNSDAGINTGGEIDGTPRLVPGVRMPYPDRGLITLISPDHDQPGRFEQIDRYRLSTLSSAAA